MRYADSSAILEMELFLLRQLIIGFVFLLLVMFCYIFPLLAFSKWSNPALGFLLCQTWVIDTVAVVFKLILLISLYVELRELKIKHADVISAVIIIAGLERESLLFL